MYTLKQVPEDFVVEEIFDFADKESGRNSYYLLKKKNYNTQRAIDHIARKLNISEKNIHFAGNKDRVAVTSQHISVLDGPHKDLEMDDLSLQYLGQSDAKTFIGNLHGNRFTIVVRNLDEAEIKKIIENSKTKTIKNYFGEQRFSKNNVEIGVALVKKEYKKAIELLQHIESDYAEKIATHLEKNTNDFVGALQILPKRYIQLFVHAVQANVFNEEIKHTEQDEELELPGFNNHKNYDAMKQLQIKNRDFINRQLPQLSIEGHPRQVLINFIEKIQTKDVQDDDLNAGKQRITITFALEKGSYATEVIRQLLE